METSVESATATSTVSGDVYASEATIARRGRDYQLRRLLAVADCTAVALGATIATGITAATPAAIDRAAWALVTLPAWIPLFKAYGLYDRDGKRVSHSTLDDIPWIFHASLVGSVLLWLFYRLVPVQEPSVSQGGLFFVGTFCSLLAARAAARALSRSITQPERVLFVGGGPSAALLTRKMWTHPEYHLDPVGYLADAEDPPGAAAGLRYLGSFERIESVCHDLRVDRVLLIAPTVDEEALADSLRRLKEVEVRISLLPQLVDVLGPSVVVDDVEGVTVIGVSAAVLTRSSRLMKRIVDLTLALPVALLALPVVALAALAVKLDSRGPVLYSQERVGRGGRHFRIYKLRTMVADADALAQQLKSASRHDAWLLLDHDPRITRVGRLLRRWSVDELPQLLNVITGSMSLVGPRPMPPDVDNQISGWGRRRLDLTPGITGLWQVLGRTDIPFEEMVKLDYLYVVNWSLWQDFRLLIRTLPAVLSRRGAN